MSRKRPTSPLNFVGERNLLCCLCGVFAGRWTGSVPSLLLEAVSEGLMGFAHFFKRNEKQNKIVEKPSSWPTSGAVPKGCPVMALKLWPCLLCTLRCRIIYASWFSHFWMIGPALIKHIPAVESTAGFPVNSAVDAVLAATAAAISCEGWNPGKQVRQ